MPAIHSITVPKWGLSMEKGRLTAWHRQVGDRISSGDEICDIETDKISGGLEVTAGGVLRRQLAREGDELTAEASELWRTRRNGIYEITVSNQRGERIALFRGRSYRIDGQVVSEE